MNGNRKRVQTIFFDIREYFVLTENQPIKLLNRNSEFDSQRSPCHNWHCVFNVDYVI